MNSQLAKTIIWLTIFSIAMGYLESVVVVYLRELYYPDGFSFPLNPIGNDIVEAEFWREVATMVMLIGVAVLAGRNAVQRFAFFLFSFAVWDIFYYVFLYVLLGWPQSLMTWDILFLIPVPWVGPVLTPIIITFLMIAFAWLMVYFDNKGIKTQINLKEWLVLILGSIVVIISWIWDYWKYMSIHNPEASLGSLSSDEMLFETTQEYVPQSFSWLIFSFGVFAILIGIGSYYLRNRKHL